LAPEFVVWLFGCLRTASSRLPTLKFFLITVSFLQLTGAASTSAAAAPGLNATRISPSTNSPRGAGGLARFGRIAGGRAAPSTARDVTLGIVSSPMTTRNVTAAGRVNRNADNVVDLIRVLSGFECER